ncbi:MAG: hypothetical protein ACYSWP_02735 [Planctomycetota bacterium]|jgi:hypothetical protein
MISRISIITLILIVGSAFAAEQSEWTGKGADDLWTTPGNWKSGEIPGATDIIVLSAPPERGPVIDSDVTCGEIRGPAWRGDRQSLDVIEGGNVTIGGWLRYAEKGNSVGIVNVLRGNVTVIGILRCSNGSRAHGIVNVVDGVIKADGMFLSDTGGGDLNVSGNSLVEFINNLTFGGNRGKLPMTINMNGGIIRVGRELRCLNSGERAGQSFINLYGGTIECASFSHSEAKYTMDITEGELMIKGDVTAEIAKDIASGYITAFGGKDTVSCRYLSGSDRTIVTATNRKKAHTPSPGNRIENVKADSKLTWQLGHGGKKYNLYIGTSLDAVGDSAKPVKQGLTVNTFDPELGFNKTYHWRVDVIDQAGKLHKGTTWQFITTDGTASDPSPAIETVNVASNSSLTWKGGLNATSHKVFFGSDPAKLVDKGIVSGNSFKPEELQFAKKYYWRVDAINASWKQSPWKGKLWSFTVDSGKAINPKPIDQAQWKPTKTTLSWKAARTTTAHTVYLSDKLEDVKNATKAVSKAQKGTTYTPANLKEATTYYWRVDQVHGDKLVKSDIWKFSTVGMLDLKLDLAVPQWNDRTKPRPGNVKPGWFTLCHPGWADMYMHDGVWLPLDQSYKIDKEGILGTGIQLLIDNGKGGNGAVMGHGLCRGGLAGDLPVFGIPEGEPIANTYFYSCDWAGQKNGDGLVLLKGLPAGVYEVKSYHNHWEPSQQQTRNCHDHVSGMPPMPSVSAKPVPTEGLPGSGAWDLVKGTGKGVVSLLEAKDVKVTSVLKDDEVATSLIKFSTDGSDVLIIYEAPDNSYPDRARSGREGSRGIWNAFELKMVSWSK